MQRDEIVAQLNEVLGTALEQWARSLSLDELCILTAKQNDDLDVSVMVKPDSVLVFDPDNRNADIELWRLRRIFSSISTHTQAVTEYVARCHNEEILAGGREYSSVLRKLMTIRDSSAEMARLLNGEDLDDGQDPDVTTVFTVDQIRGDLPNDRLTPEMIHELAGSIPRDRFTPVEDPNLKLAQVHRQVRFLASAVRNTEHPEPGPTAHELEKIATYIRES